MMLRCDYNMHIKTHAWWLPWHTQFPAPYPYVHTISITFSLTFTLSDIITPSHTYTSIVAQWILHSKLYMLASLYVIHLSASERVTWRWVDAKTLSRAPSTRRRIHTDQHIHTHTHVRILPRVCCVVITSSLDTPNSAHICCTTSRTNPSTSAYIYIRTKRPQNVEDSKCASDA